MNTSDSITIDGLLPLAPNGKSLIELLKASLTLHKKASYLTSRAAVVELQKSIDAFMVRNGLTRVYGDQQLQVAKAASLVLLTDCMATDSVDGRGYMGLQLSNSVQILHDFEPRLITDAHAWGSMEDASRSRFHEAFTGLRIPRSIAAICYRNDIGFDAGVLTVDCVAALRQSCASELYRVGKRKGRVAPFMFEFMVQDGGTLETLKSITTFLQKSNQFSHLLRTYTGRSLERIISEPREDFARSYRSILTAISEFLESPTGNVFFDSLYLEKHNDNPPRSSLNEVKVCNREQLAWVLEDSAENSFINCSEMPLVSHHSHTAHDCQLVFNFLSAVGARHRTYTESAYIGARLLGLAKLHKVNSTDAESMPEETSVAGRFIEFLIKAKISPTLKASSVMGAAATQERTIGELIATVFGGPSLALYAARDMEIRMNAAIHAELSELPAISLTPIGSRRAARLQL